jgi:hypothetical protein
LDEPKNRPCPEILLGDLQTPLREPAISIAKCQEAFGKSIDRQADDLNDRLDLPEERIGLAPDRSDSRILRLERVHDA